MRKFLGAIMTTGLMITAAPAMAGPISLSYQYTTGGNTYDFGTMTISVLAADSLQISFTAANPAGITDFEVTGFAFDFNPEQPNLIVGNPSDDLFADDQDDLDWIKMTNLNPIPQPANSDVGDDVFEFGVTEGTATNFTPPGILAGETDIFSLSGFAGLTDATDLGSMVDWAGIRIQSLEGPFDAGSLFLVGGPPSTPVPEPATLGLLSMGLFAVGIARRRRRS